MSRFGTKTRLTSQPSSAFVTNWMSRRAIRSIQRGTIALAAPALTNTATITSVDVNNSRLMYLGTITNADGPDGEAFARVALTNATTITATRGMVDTGDATVSYELIEYWPMVMRTVQRGTIAVTGTGTITAVTTAKSTLDNLGISSTSITTDPRDTQTYAVLTNATTVTATRTAAADTVTLGYQVIEWW